jgi:hypothetical protein
MRYAFLNQDSIVVNTITGELTAQQQAAFLADYSVLFGATQIVAVDDDSVAIWSGGIYDNERGFQPPPTPEPEPEPEPVIVEGASEVIEEPIAMIEETSEELLPSEVPDDALPG